ncbi:Far-red elongated hypocotyl 1, putative isoform 2 [Hibiscus syriacus]|uniref:Far-red elongated hypocotyl 1, putative isoform 2 n=1 Tax=Hibiscus syriacus TaxID=106335 RepID=A0A6A2WM60_HIBSY|nr:Far-red elongated hypocotyl 1, putative isoform 2 [Hibiscus syriacus]
MEVDNQTNTSQNNSLLNGSLKIVDLNKKRKLEAEQLGLPVSKQHCWKQILPPKPPTFVGIVGRVDGALSTCTSEVKGVDVYDVSETGSDKDSNSFPRNSDSMMSSHAESKFGTVDANYLPYDKASSSSSYRGSSSQGSRSSSSSRGLEKALFLRVRRLNQLMLK